MTKPIGFKGYLLFLLLSVVAMLGCGCAAPGQTQPQTPQEVYADVNDSVIASFEILATAKLAGVFSEADMQKIRPSVVAVDQLMRAYYAATEAGLDGGSLLVQIRAALLQLSPYIDKAAQRVKKDAGTGSYRIVPRNDSGSPGSSQAGLQDPGGRGGVQRRPQRSPQEPRGPADLRTARVPERLIPHATLTLAG